MSKIVLDDTAGGYNLSKINDNFQKIEDALNNEVLYRDNPDGEPNAMSNDLDMNGNRIFNLPEPVSPSEAARLQDVQNAISASAANLVSFTPTGDIAATNVQAAIAEVDAEMHAADTTINNDRIAGDLLIRSDLADTSSASNGDALVGVKQPFTGAVDRTQHDKNTEFVSVTDVGAVGGNGVLDKAGFEAAAAASRSVYVPQTASPFILDSLNVPAGVRFWGPGRIQTSGGTVIELSQVSLEVDESAPRIMFIESDKQGWEELLDIKACGYNTIMAYLWNGPALEQVIYNAEAVGLKVLVHSRFISANIASWSALATAAVAYDSRQSVVGYYVFDEPAGNGISVANQDAGLNYFRALTAKPLSCSENTVTFSASGSISTNYDQILIDVYYPTSSSSANDDIAAYIRNVVALGACSTRAKLIPLVGLFNDTGFTKSKTLTVQLADVLSKFSPDGSFGVFAWNAGTAGTYEGVRNVAEYRDAAKRLAATVHTVKPWRVEPIPIGTLFTVSNRLAEVYYNTTDGAFPGIPGATNLVPWYTQNTGVATNTREQPFTDNGLMYKGTTARCGFAGMPAGVCCGYLRWDDRQLAAGCTISMGSSSTLGYSTTAAGGDGTQVIANGGSVVFHKQLSSTSFDRLPTLDVTTVGALSFPYGYLKGYLAFTDVPEVAF